MRCSVLALVALLSPLTARAELPTFVPSAVPPEPDRPFVFASGNLGLNAPLGFFGVELGVGYEWFRLGAGAGYGLGGPQISATIRALTRMRSVDVGVGLGFSRGGSLHDAIDFGDLDGRDDSPGATQFDENTLWANLELVLELPLPGGAFTRIYGGITSPIYIDCVHQPETGPDEPCTMSHRQELQEDRYQPFVGFATGFRWPQPPRSRKVWLPSRAAPPPPFGL